VKTTLINATDTPEAAGGYAQAIEITGEPGKLPHPCRQTADMRTLP